MVTADHVKISLEKLCGMHAGAYPSCRKTVEDVDEGGVWGPPSEKMSKTGSFSRKKYTIWHKFFHLGKGLN